MWTMLAHMLKIDEIFKCLLRVIKTSIYRFAKNINNNNT
jgi:hypothetical protein